MSWGANAAWEQSGDAWQAGNNDASAGGNAWQADQTAAGGQGAWDAWQTAAPPPAGGKEEDQAWAAQPPPAKEFWETQAWNKQNNTLSRKADWQLDEEDTTLFKNEERASAGLEFERYEAVPVEVSGSKHDLIPVCRSFQEIVEKFRDFVPQAVVDNLKRLKYETPTPVQKFAVPVGLCGRDIMCCAQTGSGKTAAFLIPIIGTMIKQHTSPIGGLEVPFEGPCSPYALILTPTRELCLQIFEEAQKFVHRTPYRASRVYGGEGPKIQMAEIAYGADVLVATPGRLLDFLSRGIISVKSVNLLVLDEADRMLDMGFEKDVRRIVDEEGMASKEHRQTMMFSATFPETCQRMAQDFLYDHIWIAVGVLGGAVETVEQVLTKVAPSEKFDKLMEILDNWYAELESTGRKGKERMLVFANAKDTARWLDEQLYEKKMDSGALHGDLDQAKRELNLGRFRRGEIDVMIATDVAARGLDIQNVAVVVNYDFPKEIDTYVHRIGRTGRIGNRGKAISFIAFESDSCKEQVYTMAELVKVMEKSKAELPDWLDQLTQGAADGWGSWGKKESKWGNEDVRKGTEGVQQSKWSSSGEQWGTDKQWPKDQGWSAESKW